VSKHAHSAVQMILQARMPNMRPPHFKKVGADAGPELKGDRLVLALTEENGKQARYDELLKPAVANARRKLTGPGVPITSSRLCSPCMFMTDTTSTPRCLWDEEGRPKLLSWQSICCRTWSRKRCTRVPSR